MRLRPIITDDSARLLSWRNSPHVADFMFTNQEISPADHERWFTRVLRERHDDYWIIEYHDEPVGLANLAEVDPRNERASWAFYLGKRDVPGPVAVGVEFEIMGIAFGERGFHKLTSEVLAFNDRVVTMHERAGFVREGVLRDHVKRSDGRHDVVVLSMLRPEWEERHAARWRRRRS